MGQVNFRGSLPISASNILEPMLHPSAEQKGSKCENLSFLNWSLAHLFLVSILICIIMIWAAELARILKMFVQNSTNKISAHPDLAFQLL